MSAVEQPFTIEAGSLRATFEAQTPRVLVEHASGARLELRPDPDPRLARVWRAGRRSLGQGRLRGRAGAAHRVEIQAWLGGGPGLRWCLELDEEGQGLAAVLAVENRGAESIALAGLRPLVVAGSGPGWEERALWSDERDRPVESIALATSGSDAAFLLGFTSAFRGFGRAETGEPPAATWHPAPGTAIAPGGCLESDRAWLGAASDTEALLDAWARRAGAEMAGRAPGRASVGWRGGARRFAAASRHPLRALPAPPADEIVRVGAAAYRRALEANSARLGDGALGVAEGPFLASVGLVDARRVPGDGLRFAQANLRLWLSAPDPLDPSAWDEETLRARLTVAGLGAGCVELAVPPDAWPEPGRGWLARTLPPLGREARARGDAQLVAELLGERRAVVLLNRSDRAQPLGASLRELGLHGPFHVFDFWENEDLGLRDDAVPAREIAAGGCRLLGLTPPADRPRVVGTTIHVGLGTLEVASLRQGPDRDLVLALRHPGEHAGDVWIALPGSPRARRVSVRFTDEAEVRLRGHQGVDQER